MAPKKQKKLAARKRAEPKRDSDPNDLDQPTAGSAPPPVTLSDGEVKKLFQSVEMAEREVEQSEARVKDAERKLSDALGAISKSVGSGPFEIKGTGQRFGISSRNGLYFKKGLLTNVRVI
jgi:hypothetical protein